MRHRVHAALAAFALASASAPLAQPAGPSEIMRAEADRNRLDEALGRAVRPLSLRDGQIGGEGGAWLHARLQRADIVMIGESHGTGSVAEAAGLIVDALPTDRPLAYALEMGAAGAAIQEPLLRGPVERHEAYMADPRRAIGFAFLNLREEAALARRILARSGKPGAALWGLDQEFATSAPLLLDRLEGLARTTTQRRAIAQARERVKSLMALSTLPDSFYEPLDRAFAAGPQAARDLLADMRLSSRIYRDQNDAPSLSNRTREDHMKRRFLAYWRAAGRDKPRVVMKFGGYHLTAGLSPTATPALGGFVHALALIESKTTLSLLMVCGPDGQQIDFRGAVQPCTGDFEATAGLFRRRLLPEDATLIDTAPLRLIPGTLRRLVVPEDIRNYIQSYDAIIVLRGARAATPFAPPPASLFEGM